MFSTKIRPAAIALVTTASLAFTLAAPAASQAQWHTIVVGGHVFTHGNFTEGGVGPCERIEGQLGKWQGAVGALAPAGPTAVPTAAIAPQARSHLESRPHTNFIYLPLPLTSLKVVGHGRRSKVVLESAAISSFKYRPDMEDRGQRSSGDHG